MIQRQNNSLVLPFVLHLALHFLSLKVLEDPISNGTTKKQEDCWSEGRINIFHKKAIPLLWQEACTRDKQRSMWNQSKYFLLSFTSYGEDEVEII